MSSDHKRKPSRPAGSNDPNAGKAARAQAPTVAIKPASDEAEPTADLAHTPIWLVILFALVFYWGQLYIDNHAGGFSAQVYEPYINVKGVKDANPGSDEDAAIARGEALYINCSVCHQNNGLGSPGQYPPLAGSEWVLEPNPARLIRIPLHGLSGPIKVKGQDWNLPAGMTPAGASFPNEDLAALLTYIRQAWGNKAPAVTPQQVAKVKEEVAGRAMDGSAPWTADDLLKIPVP
jgi:mono/diheme cytochrome c family protein